MNETDWQDVRCIGYCRVSTERQAGEQFTSLTDQANAITSLATKLGVAVGRWYRDEGASGATVEKRPAFRALLSDCAQHPRDLRQPGYVLVLNDSRFGRFDDPDQAAALRFQLKQHGWIVRFAEGDELQDPTFRSVIRSLGSAQASEYRRSIIRNARRGTRGTAEQGYWAREAPFGYRRRVVFPTGSERILDIGVLKAPNEKISLAIHEQEAATVRWAFETYASGHASLSILKRGFEERHPGRTWSRQTIRLMLMNRTYTGDVIGGMRTKDEHGREVRNGAESVYGKTNAHPAIVSHELFEKTQTRFGRNRKFLRSRPGDYLLSGIMLCSHCGSHFVGGGGGKSRSKNPLRDVRRFYKCTGGIAEPPKCAGRIGTVFRHIVDDAVVHTMSEVIGSPAVRKEIAAALDEALDAQKQQRGNSRPKLAAERENLERKRDRLVALVADGTLTGDEAAKQLASMRAEIARVTAQLGHVANSHAPIAKADRDRLLSAALDFPSIASRLSGVALQELIRPWLHRAVFDKVTRALTLEIRTVPALPGLRLASWPARDGQQQSCKLIIRRISLLQKGHSPCVSPPSRRKAG